MGILETLSLEEQKNLKRISLERNEVLFREGEECFAVGLLLSGNLKISSYLYNGDEIIYNLINSNELFGNNLIFSSTPIHKGNVTALSDSTIVLFEKKQLLKLLKENEQFLLAYLKAQSDFGKQLNFRIKLLSIGDAKERIMLYITSKKNAIYIKNITSFANELNLARETVSRIIHDLEKEKTIIFDGHYIKLKQ